MPDEEKGEAKGEEGKGDGEEGGKKTEPKRGCCDKFSECLVLSFQKTATCITNSCNAVGVCCSYWWYPMKECCVKKCDKCSKNRHPWKDPAYHAI